MWNYSYVMPSLFILCVFLGYYFRSPRIPLRINRTFIKLVAVETLVMLADIVSTWACMHYEILSGFILYFLNDLYFITFYLRGYMFFLFTINVLRVGLYESKGFNLLLQLPVIISSLLCLTSPVTHLIFYFDESGYHSGSLYNILYVVFTFYILASVAATVRYKDRLRRRWEFKSCIWYNIVLFLGLCIRYLFPSYLLMDTFCLMSLIVIYLSYENPEFYLEGRTWIFNSRAFREYIEEISNRRHFRIIELVVHNYMDNRGLYGVKQMDQGTALIGDFFRQAFSKEKVFYYRNGRYIILGDADMDFEGYMGIIRERFSKPFESEDAELFLDIGGAFLEFGKRGLKFESIMNLVEDSFSIAENLEGGNAAYIDDAVIERNIKLSEVKKSLKYAIEHDSVLVYLHPIYSTKTGKIVGAEALARLQDANGNIIPPGLFIPIAEKNGMINQLGEQIFKKTCRFIGENDVEKMGLSWINVNLSPIQFMRPDLDEMLYSYTKQYGVDPGFIHLEITEEAMIDDGLLLKQMQAISDKGFKFVLDDYGRGYSNMTRLKKCPFINVKLDMSIVWDYCDNPDNIIPNMVSTFGKIGFGITAEGIETKDMMEKMADIGVDFLQGFFFSKPLPVDEFVSHYMPQK